MEMTASGLRHQGMAFLIPAGFTLLEVLIAMAIFSVGLLALAVMSTVVIKSNDRANRLTVATLLAEERMGEIATTAYYDLETKAATTTAWDGKDYLLDQTVAAGPEIGILQIDVSVSWTGMDRQSRSVRLSTLRADPL